MQRSLSITIIAFLQGFISVVSTASGIFLLLLTVGSIQVFSHDLADLPLYLKGLVAIDLAISLLGVAVTYGLWTLKPWGWLGSLIFQLLCILNNGLVILAGQEITSSVYFSIVISIALLGTLWMPSVRAVIESNRPDANTARL